MNTKTLSKVNKFGKIGKIVMTILFVAAVIVTLLSCTAAIYSATLPNDAVSVTVTNNAEFKINENSFASIWNFLNNKFSYMADKDPSDMLKDDSNNKILPPEGKELDTELNFFNQSYSSATIRSEKGKKIIDAKSSPAEYRSSDLATLLIFATIFIAFVSVALFMLQRIFKVLSVCESPFCKDFVSKLRIFGYSLIPVAIFASIGETLAVRFLSSGKGAGVCVQWGIIVAFAVTMCLVTVFRYGVQLQKESDETL